MNHRGALRWRKETIFFQTADSGLLKGLSGKLKQESIRNYRLLILKDRRGFENRIGIPFVNGILESSKSLCSLFVLD
jgi:hypothetical protein